MKVIKRGLYITLFIISLFIINTSVKAYDIFTTYHSGIYTEVELYEEFSKIENFDINTYKNIYCTKSGNYAFCYALTDDIVNSFSLNSINIKLVNSDNCIYYYVNLYQHSINNQSSGYKSCSYNNGNITYNSSSVVSNFDFNFLTDEENKKNNVLDFSDYISSEEEKEELEITVKGTEILNFMLDKTKNIYEVLINNQIFQLCLGVLLSYLVFMVIYRIMKK